MSHIEGPRRSTHTGQPPLDDISWSATVVLLVIGGGLAGAGLAASRRRDVATT